MKLSRQNNHITVHIVFFKFHGPFLCKGITLAIFHSNGIVSLKIAVLKIFVNRSAITGAAIRIILPGILSIPVNLQAFRDRSLIRAGVGAEEKRL